MAQGSRGAGSAYRLVATFGSAGAAEDAVHRLLEAGFEQRKVVVDASGDQSTSLQGEAREEVGGLQAGPGVVVTRGQRRGFRRWAPIGALAGAALLAPFSLIHMSGLSLGARLVIFLVVGAFGGGTVGFVSGGGLGPGATGEMAPPDAQRGYTVGVHSQDERDVERAYDILAAAGPARMDREDADGGFLEPSLKRATE